MRSSFTAIVVAALAASVVGSWRVEKRENSSVVKLPLYKNVGNQQLKRRQGTVQSPDIDYLESLLYIVELLVGTPPQAIFVQLDTGSSDLIVETPTSDICSATPPNPCTSFGSYNANASSTYNYIDSNFQVAYGGGDGGTGDWCSDTLGFGGASLQNAQFGILYRTTVQEGILGVGYPIIESRNTFSGEPIYPNFPVLLVQQGYIASRAFSLYTNADNNAAVQGELLFGGIDTDKFTPPLVTIDLIPSGFDGFPGAVDFTISLLAVSATGDFGPVTSLSYTTSALNVLMDSGTTLTYLPSSLVLQIWNTVAATPYSANPDLAYVQCTVVNTVVSINLSFDGITIPIPTSQLVIGPPDVNGNCLFGIAIGAAPYIVGDTCLTSIYAVYDLDNNQMSLAPALLGVTTSNILQIMAGPGGVPDTGTISTSSQMTSTSSSTSSSVSSSASSSSTGNTATSASSSSSSSSSFTTSSSSSSTSISVSSSTTPTSTSTRPTTTTPTSKPLVCNHNNCLNALINLAAPGTTFCESYFAGLQVPTPTGVSKACTALPSKISSACSCIYSGTAPPPPLSTTSTSSSSKSSSTLSTSTTSKSLPHIVCNKDNCLRAIQNTATPYGSFCSSYQAGLAPSVPPKINQDCATSASRISSGCACLSTA